MAKELADSFLEALSQSVVYPFFAVELFFDNNETLRLWSGDLTISINGYDWVGAGNLLTVDAIEETSEISAKGATLTLSAIPEEVLSLSLTQAYQGRVGKIYFGAFTGNSIKTESDVFLLTEDGSKIYLETSGLNMYEVFSGYMDQMNIDEGPETSTLSLMLENKLVRLEKASTARYTSAYQKSKYPNDKGFDFVEDLQTKEVYWGRSVS